MKAAIIQPSFFPWPGYFNLIKSADIFVFLDTVQYTRRDWRSKNCFKLRSGNIHTLSIPVKAKGRPPINEVEIDLKQFNTQKFLRFFSHNYGKSPHYHEILPLIKPSFLNPKNKLSDFCCLSTQKLCSYLNIQTPLIKASSLNITNNNPTRRLIEICLHIGANEYLSGLKGKYYIDNTLFQNHAISLQFQNYPPPQYRQFDNTPFLSHLSIIDLLCNTGKQASNFL